MVLRARIDIAHPNMNLRDPVMYRIKRMHHRVGDAWPICPSYDFTHGQSDSLGRSRIRCALWNLRITAPCTTGLSTSWASSSRQTELRVWT